MITPATVITFENLYNSEVLSSIYTREGAPGVQYIHPSYTAGSVHDILVHSVGHYTYQIADCRAAAVRSGVSSSASTSSW